MRNVPKWRAVEYLLVGSGGSGLVLSDVFCNESPVPVEHILLRMF
jgi:hypothetical protein